MNVAELFVTLGIKGADKTVGSLDSVKKGLGNVSSMSLEAKAAILGAMYALQRMTAVSGQAGTDLTNFSLLTGKSAQELQKWQYAARQAGESSEDLAGSVKGVQSAMTNMLLNGDAPKGLKEVARAAGGIDPTRIRDTFYMMDKLATAARNLPADVGNQFLKGFGVSDAFIASARKGVFTEETFKKAPKYSDTEISSLDKSNIAWSNLGKKIEMAFGHFNAKHGQQIVAEISMIVTAVVKLAEAFERLAERLKVFQLIGKVFEGWAIIFDKIYGATDKVKGNKEGAKGLLGMGGDALKEVRDFAKGAWETYKENADEVYSEKNYAKVQAGIAPKVSIQPKAPEVKNVNINQNIQHHGDGKDTKAVKDAHGHAIKSAYYQSMAQRVFT